jgi:hypothetical protein
MSQAIGQNVNLSEQLVHQNMNPDTRFSWSEAKATATRIVAQSTGRHLSDIEVIVLQGAWQGKTYEELASLYGYSVEYLNKDVGNKLWRKLSEAIAERVTKKNFREALQRVWQAQFNQTVNESVIQNSNSAVDIPFPEGAVALNSPFYIERDGIESLCYETVTQPGALIRIKAPKLMGKTSLVNRILVHAERQHFQLVYLDLGNVDRAVLNNLNRFLRWLCLMTSRQLNLENRIDDFWDTDILGSNDNCTSYFEEYFLTEVNCPIVLAFDDVDRLFCHVEIIEDFLGMLRSWHEKAKIFDVWQQLHLIFAHSTEIYIPLDINQSPFNAGVPVELREFNSEQVKLLADLHGLNWNSQVEPLMTKVGGHPYLLRLAMYYVSSTQMEVNQLLQEAATESGIYSHHLRRHLETLQRTPELAEAFKTVVTSPNPVELDSMQIYKLHSMGLVQCYGNEVTPRCDLYRQYFCRVLT